jgi:hypothetical protein
VLQQIAMVPPREGEKWSGGTQEGRRHGRGFRPGAHALFVDFFHECCSQLGTSEL